MRLGRRALIVGLGAWVAGGGVRTAAAAGEEGVEFIGVDEVRQLQPTPRRLVLVDVRSAEEFQETRIAGAVNVPLGEIERRVAEIPRQGLVVLY